MTDPDLTLVGKARRGDARALEALYRTHGNRLLGFLVRSLGDRPLAEDVFQEVWIKVMRGIGAFRTGQGSFRAWLFRIGNNTAVDRLRRETLRAGPSLDVPAASGEERTIDRVASPAPGPDRTGESAVLGDDLARALGALPERQRTAILLHHQQGFTYGEIARVLDTPEGTVKTLVHRGVLALRRRLSGWRESADDL